MTVYIELKKDWTSRAITNITTSKTTKVMLVHQYGTNGPCLTLDCRRKKNQNWYRINAKMFFKRKKTRFKLSFHLLAS